MEKVHELGSEPSVSVDTQYLLLLLLIWGGKDVSKLYWKLKKTKRKNWWTN